MFEKEEEYDEAEEEEECDECVRGLEEVPDVENAVDYLTKNRLIILDWEGVETDLQTTDKPIVDCLLDSTYINVNDPCLLEAGMEVIEVFRENKDQFADIERCWNALVETVSRTYTSCSTEFREKVKEDNR